MMRGRRKCHYVLCGQQRDSYPAYPHSPDKAFAYMLKQQFILLVDSERSEQIARINRMIWICTICVWHYGYFPAVCIIFNWCLASGKELDNMPT